MSTTAALFGQVNADGTLSAFGPLGAYLASATWSPPPACQTTISAALLLRTPNGAHPHDGSGANRVTVTAPQVVRHSHTYANRNTGGPKWPLSHQSSSFYFRGSAPGAEVVVTINIDYADLAARGEAGGWSL